MGRNLSNQFCLKDYGVAGALLDWTDHQLYK
jgi:hypothetical protein